jgi:tetratricopeptide (TPR) repeat protein
LHPKGAFSSLSIKKDLNYASTLTNKGVSLAFLAEQGIETESNLKESVKCFDEAAPIFKKEQSDLKYASTLMSKGNSLIFLAEQGIETESNLKESVKCFDEAAPIFKKEQSDWDYASTLTNKGVSLAVLAEQGIETESNLKESVKCFDEAAPIFKKEQSDLDYARTLANKGNRLRILAEQGIEAESNLRESVKCFDEAAPIFKKEQSDWDYASALMNKGNSLMILAEQGIEVESNLNESVKCFDEAAPIFKKRKSDLAYARTLANKGSSLRILAKQGIETESNLKESVKCFDEATLIFKREKSDLDYAGTLTNKGNSLMILAEQGIETENNFERAISSYMEAEDIFFKKSSFLFKTSLNHCIALWWRYTETKEDKYLEDAIEIAKKAREESARVVHPAKEQLIDLSFQVYDTLRDKPKASEKEYYEEMHKKMDEVLAYVNMLPEMRGDIIEIKVKTTTILEHVRGIETSCNRIIHDLEESGVKLREEDKEELKTLAEDFRNANKEQLTNFTKELIKLLKDPQLQKEIEKKAPKGSKSIVKKAFYKITDILNELSIALSAAVTAEALLPHIEAIMHQITILSGISPALASTLILIPLIALKVRTVK